METANILEDTITDVVNMNRLWYHHSIYHDLRLKERCGTNITTTEIPSIQPKTQTACFLFSHGHLKAYSVEIWTISKGKNLVQLVCADMELATGV